MGKENTDTLVNEAKPETKKSNLYQVVLINDDFTPMDFVVVVLQKFFYLDEVTATKVMLEVHNKGIGVCGVFPKGIAETKVAEVNRYARQHDHPLLCSMRKL